MRCYVLMGVSGCGKTSVGTALTVTCGVEFVDGDDLHPQPNIDKMARGIPLDDDDRAPWLRDVGRTLAQTDKPIVIGCSALKKKYRDAIRSEVPEPVRFVHLAAPKEVLARRVAARTGHFMPAQLLDSQYAALEHLDPEELGTRVDISVDYADMIQNVEHYVRDTLI